MCARLAEDEAPRLLRVLQQRRFTAAPVGATPQDRGSMQSPLDKKHTMPARHSNQQQTTRSEKGKGRRHLWIPRGRDRGTYLLPTG